MSARRFLSKDNALWLQQKVIEHDGGSAGIRDQDALSSALYMPQASFGGELLHADLSAMTAAYLYHLCQNHPFLDGNKRVALGSALCFLELNGISIETDFDMDPDVLTETVLRVAAGKLSKEELTLILRKYIPA